MTKNAATDDFDPNSAAAGDSGIFGLGCSEADAAVVYLPVPWEATASYGGGGARGPRAVLAASRQIDLYDGDVLRPYEAGLHLLEESDDARGWGEAARAEAEKVIAVGGELNGDKALASALADVNAAGERLNEFVRVETLRRLEAGKLLGVLGGDHSVPFGALQAAAQVHQEFGVLHFDAHHDLRAAYEGFTWSHASILRNALERIPQITQVVQVGIRDYCEQEADYAREHEERVKVFYDRDISRRLHEGAGWGAVAREVVEALAENVWVTFDIDGLDPRLCPHTGTPVPGGLDFNQANHLLGEVVRSGRRIIGFDLCEVAPDPSGASDWDANVGARLLYKLSAWTLASHGKAELQP